MNNLWYICVVRCYSNSGEEAFMRKIGKTRKGFTLVEMVLVIAIIVILAGVLVIGIGTYLNRAMATTSSLNSHNSSIISITEEVERQMGIDGEDGEGEGA